MPRITDVLPLLKGVKPIGKAKWMALCPAHEDHNPSLQVTISDKGNAILHCFAGCHYTTIFQVLGIYNDSPTNNSNKKRIEKIYDYYDSNGNLLFQKIRYVPKSFAQRRPDGKGGFFYNLVGIQPVLYNLPHVIKSDEIIFVEGEKDADNLIQLGFVATTCPTTTGRWEQSYNEYLKNKNVIIIPDNDEPGRKHALDICNHLTGISRSIKYLQLPDLSDHGDVTVFVSKYPNKEDAIERLSIMIEYCSEWKPSPIVSIQPTISSVLPDKTFFSFPYTDIGNAERLIFLHGELIRYIPHWKKWLIWDEKRWKIDETGEINFFAKDTIRKIYRDIDSSLSKEEVKTLTQTALRFESDHHIKAMLSRAQSEKTIPIVPDNLDSDQWLLNCLNGTIDLKSGKLKSHCRTDLITILAPFSYDPDASCPLFLNFINRIFDNRQGLISFIQRAFGYSLTGCTNEDSLFFLYGQGANGKSTLLEIFRLIFGDYAKSTPFDTLLVRQGNSIRNDIANLQGARFVTASEVDPSKRFDESVIKQLTGGDTISARKLYQEHFDFKPTFKIFLAANHKPKILDTTLSIWRRIKLIPFDVTIPEPERDKALLSKLQSELSGIFNWALEGCLSWQREGLCEPDEVKTSTNTYRQEMDTLSNFINECCIIKPDAIVSNKDLRSAYDNWCDSNGEFKINQKVFGILLNEKGFEKYSAHGNYVHRRGIGLLDSHCLVSG